MSKYGSTALPIWSSVKTIYYAPDVALSQSSVTPQQPTTVPIAHVSSNPNLTPNGALIDMNPSFIMYGVKNGLVRVIDRNNASSRVLLRGHNERITDIAFFGKDAAHNSSISTTDVLATVGGDDAKPKVLIWRLLRCGEELTAEKLLEVRFRSVERMIWHPFNPNQLLVSHRIDPSQNDSVLYPTVLATLIITTGLVTVSHETEGHAVCFAEETKIADEFGLTEVIPGTLQLVVGGQLSTACRSCIVDMCWSNKDARHVLTAHQDGKLRLWDLRSRVYVTPVGDQIDFVSSMANAKNKDQYKACMLSAKCLMTYNTLTDGEDLERNSEGVLQQCMFLSPYDDASVLSDPSSVADSLLTAPFITASKKGACVSLWSPFSTNGAFPSKVRSLEIMKEKCDQSYQISFCPACRIPAQPPSSYLLFTDKLEGNIFALHLAADWIESNIMSVVRGFDYIVQLQTVNPIFSCSVSTESVTGSNLDQCDIDICCVQNKAVQMLSLPLAKLAPTIRLITEDSELPPGVTCSFDKGNYETSNISYEDFDDGEIDIAQHELSDGCDVDDGDLLTASTLQFSTGDSNGAFANWLGNLTLNDTKAKSSVPPTPQVTPLVKSKSVDVKKSSSPAILTLPAISLPVPFGDNNVHNSQNNLASRDSALKTQLLLSPMALLTSSAHEKSDAFQKRESVSDSNSIIEDTSDFPEIVTKKKDALSLKKSSAKFATSGSAKQQEQKIPKLVVKESHVVAPVTSKGEGKISILKRDIDTATSDFEKTTGVTSLSHPSEESDVILRKFISSQFKQQVVMEIQKSIRSEMQAYVLPSLSKTVAQTVEQSVTKVIQPLLTKQIQGSLKEHSKDVIEAVVKNIKDPVTDAFFQSMREVLIPAYENGTRQMFSQISSSLEASLNVHEIGKNRNEDLLMVLQHMTERMDAMSRMVEVLITSVTHLTKNQSLPCTITPPLIPVDPEQELRNEIISLINMHEFEKAFTRALSASNAEFALLACKNSDLTLVLEGETSRLSQPILLCLMQQLGANLLTNSSDDSKVCLSWLQNIAVTLDPQHESIKKHSMKVCAQVVENINKKLSEGDQTLRRPLQMLLQVVRGISNL